MRRVAIISLNSSRSTGGVERVVSIHQQILSKAGYDVRIFSMPVINFKKQTIFSKLIYKISLVVFPVFSSIWARAWSGMDGKVFSHGYSSIGLFCDVVFAHGCWEAFRKLNNLPRTAFGRLAFLYEKLAGLNAKKIVAVSDAVKNDWIKYYNAEASKIYILYNCVEQKIFFPNNRHELRDADDHAIFRVLFVGRLENAKGLATLSKLCFSILEYNNTNITLIICTPQAPSYKVRAMLPGACIKVNLSPTEMSLEYNNADLLLLPSKYEAFELCTLESISCGTPVMLNDTGARPTLIRLHCPGVFCHDPELPPADQISNIIHDIKAVDRYALSEWARTNFNISHVVASLVMLAGER